MADLKYEHVVVGSGVSGMTSALLLALLGRKVLLLEKAPAIGGSMARFTHKGVPFDIGFHFTGGFEQGGLLLEMLTILGIRDRIHPLRFSSDMPVHFILEDSLRRYSLPATRAPMLKVLKRQFPGEEQAIDTYFQMVDDVCTGTENMDIRCIGVSPEPLDEDFITLQAVLDDLTENADLKAILSAYCMCYGVRPKEVSFANHARMCQALYDDVVRVEGGGDAFVDAFRDGLARAGVDVLCGRSITACEDIEKSMVRRFRLDNGDSVSFDSCVLTIHPKAILDLLPSEFLRNAFISRVSAFEPSTGFFSVFAVCRDVDAMEDGMVTLFPDENINRMLEEGHRGEDSALFFISNVEEVDGRECRVVTAFEASPPGDLAEWSDSKRGSRPPAYEAYKRAKTERICERIVARFPELEGQLEVITSSSVLTFRDYLNSPDGSAYGVKQKVGQFNLFGKLPLRNLYVAGQSSLLPGVMGAMVSSFITTRALVDRGDFQEFILRRLDQ